MNLVWKVLGAIGLVILVQGLASFAFGFPGGAVVNGLCLIYGGMLFAFLYYRQIRQEEVRHILVTAAESGVPLPNVLYAYVRDRPQGSLREVWVGVLLFFVLPGYYWIWHRANRFDRKVERLIELLLEGVSLPEALRQCPGVATPHTVMAAAVGQTTGRVGPALRSAARHELAPVWLTIVPRLVYPIIILLTLFGVVSFSTVFVMPKLEKIYLDFHLKLPEETETLLAWARPLVNNGLLVLLGFVNVVLLIGFVSWSSSVCWYLPGIGRLYRMHAQARVLKTLGLLLDAGTPVPAALDVLSDPQFFESAVCRRLRDVRHDVDQGQPLGEPLRRHGLLPRAMLPLVQAAERARNLPWALAELGDHLARRTVRLAQRWSLALFPVTVLLVGCVVGFVVVAMFLPLVGLIEGVGQ